MNEFLKSVQPENLVEQRTKLHARLVTTTTTTTTTTITTTSPTITATANITVPIAETVTFAAVKWKRNHHPHRAQQQNSSLKTVKSLYSTGLQVLLLFAIIFHSATASSLPGAVSSAATLNPSRFTEQEIELLRKAFLKKFGMKEQPKQDKPVLPVPNYVWRIYDKVKNEDVDWVRHYYPHNILESDESTLLLQYDLSVTVQNTTSELINRAELKLKLRSEDCRRHVKIYEIDQRNPEIWRLLDAKFIESNWRQDYQWVDMDVTEAVRRRRPNMNRVDFAVELSGSNLAAHPSTSSQAAIFSALPHSRKQAAALVVYVQTADHTVKVRRKRKANIRRRHQHKKHNHRPADRNYCRRTELSVDFNELNWQDWILAPSSYSAYQCQGQCPNPLTSHFNTTNHAIVQGLINSVDPSLVPAPCCVPTEMESLAILYIDVEGKIVIKNYPDMEVLSCGCR